MFSSQNRLPATNPTVWLCDLLPVQTFEKGPFPENANLERWWTYLSQFRLTVLHIQGIKINWLSIYLIITLIPS